MVLHYHQFQQQQLTLIITFGEFDYNLRKNARYYTLIAYNDNDSDENQFKIQIHLQASTQYVMRIITFNQNIDGNYTIVASGLTPINIEKIADSLFPILNHSPCGG
ncbi:unnamed protein product [Adineta ricciae]|uniref:Uncharacterized protein n=1 Tax=Adineta ricciae TaxID=249248 RepID=A0A815K9L8_ADIRI|nr:unnamed protein product [Adineta ricciae]